MATPEERVWARIDAAIEDAKGGPEEDEEDREDGPLGRLAEDVQERARRVFDRIAGVAEDARRKSDVIPRDPSIPHPDVPNQTVTETITGAARSAGDVASSIARAAAGGVKRMADDPADAIPGGVSALGKIARPVGQAVGLVDDPVEGVARELQAEQPVDDFSRLADVADGDTAEVVTRRLDELPEPALESYQTAPSMEELATVAAADASATPAAQARDPSPTIGPVPAVPDTLPRGPDGKPDLTEIARREFDEQPWIRKMAQNAAAGSELFNALGKIPLVPDTNLTSENLRRIDPSLSGELTRIGGMFGMTVPEILLTRRLLAVGARSLGATDELFTLLARGGAGRRSSAMMGVVDGVPTDFKFALALGEDAGLTVGLGSTLGALAGFVLPGDTRFIRQIKEMVRNGDVNGARAKIIVQAQKGNFSKSELRRIMDVLGPAASDENPVRYVRGHPQVENPDDIPITDFRSAIITPDADAPYTGGNHALIRDREGLPPVEGARVVRGSDGVPRVEEGQAAGFVDLRGLDLPRDEPVPPEVARRNYLTRKEMAYLMGEDVDVADATTEALRRRSASRPGGSQDAALGAARSSPNARDFGEEGNAARRQIQDAVTEYVRRPDNSAPPGELGRANFVPKDDGLDEDFASRVARAYDEAENNPNDPAVRAAYEQFAREIEEQYRFVTEVLGIRMIPTEDDPYRAAHGGPSSKKFMEDILNNKQLKVFASELSHPLLTDEQNLKFRFIHDVLGHTMPGNTVSALGEENAFRAHAEMFSPEARKAMATETRGQNSWFNFGPKSDLPPAERPFADQKAFILPDELRAIDPEAQQPRRRDARPATSEQVGGRAPAGEDAAVVSRATAEANISSNSKLDEIVEHHNAPLKDDPLAEAGSSQRISSGEVEQVTEGFVVSPFKPRQRTLNRDKLARGTVHGFIQKNKDLLLDPEGRYVLGTWSPKGEKRQVLDVNVVTNDLEEAIRIGQEANQEALWDANAERVIDLQKKVNGEYTGEMLDPELVWRRANGLDDNQLLPETEAMLRLAVPGGVGAGVGAAAAAQPGGATPAEGALQGAAIGAIGAAALGAGVPSHIRRMLGDMGEEGFARITKHRSPLRILNEHGTNPADFLAVLRWRNKWRSPAGARRLLDQVFPDLSEKEITRSIRKAERIVDDRIKGLRPESGIPGETVPETLQRKARELYNAVGTKGAVDEAVGTPATMKMPSWDRMVEMARNGEWARLWYEESDINVLRQMFGDDARIVAGFLAATSPDTQVASNVTQALKAYRQWKLGSPFKGYKKSVIDDLRRVVRGEDLPGQKVGPFNRNLAGDKDAVTIDVWMSRAFGFGDQPTAAELRFMQEQVRQIANEIGDTPRETQARIWGQIKKLWNEADMTTSRGADDESFGTLLGRRLDQQDAVGRMLNELASVAGKVKNDMLADMPATRPFARAAERAKKSKRPPIKDRFQQADFLAQLADESGYAVPDIMRVLAGASVGGVVGAGAGAAGAEEGDRLSGAIAGGVAGALAGGAGVAAPARERVMGAVGGTVGASASLPGSDVMDNPGKALARTLTGGLKGASAFLVVPKGGSSILRRLDDTVAADFIRKNFTITGDLPEEMFRAKRRADASVSAHVTEANHTLQHFGRAVEDEWGVHYSELPQNKVDQINAALRDKSLISQLPERLQEPVEAMRKQVDALSKAFVREGIVEGEMTATFEANLGAYLTRSYRIWDDPKWADNIPQDVVNKAKSYLREVADATFDDPEDAAVQAKLWYDELVDRSGPIQMFQKLNKMLGEKDVGILERREGIPTPIRALWGEVDDPVESYAKSVGRMAQTLENHRMLTQWREDGMGRWFFKESDKHGRARSGASAVITEPEGPRSLKPLAGLRTTPEMKEVLRGFFDPKGVLGGTDIENALYGALVRANGAAKWAKTIGSLQTHVRNLVGNVGFAVANGHNLLAMAANKDAWRVVRSNMGVLGFTDGVDWDVKQYQKFYRDLQRLEVVDQSVRAGELQDLLGDALMRTQRDGGLLSNPLNKGALERMKKTGKALTSLYSAEDDVWKVLAYASDFERYVKAGFDPEKAKEIAARNTVATFPTYSIVPPGIRALRRIPAVGTFVSFPFEVWRTANNAIDIALRELRDPKTRNIGIQRMRGLFIAASVPGMLEMGTKMTAGMTESDSENARKFMPPWSEDATILWMGRGDGNKIDYLDLSYTDPHAYIRTAVEALVSGEDHFQALGKAAVKTLEPFVGREISTGRFFDVLRNEKPTGAPVYSTTDPQKWQDITGYLLGAVEPGTVTSIRRFLEAEGMAEKAREGGAAVTGFRPTTVDIPRSLGFRIRDFGRDVRDAKRNAENEQDEKDRLDRIFEEYAEYLEAAHQVGMSKLEVFRVLDDIGFIANADKERLIREAGLLGAPRN